MSQQPTNPNRFCDTTHKRERLLIVTDAIADVLETLDTDEERQFAVETARRMLSLHKEDKQPSVLEIIGAVARMASMVASAVPASPGAADNTFVPREKVSGTSPSAEGPAQQKIETPEEPNPRTAPGA